MFDVVGLVEASREVADVDVASISDDDLLAAAVGLEGVLSSSALGQARFLGEIAKRGLTDVRYGQPVQRWVAGEAKVDRAGVHRRLKLGQRLGRLGVAQRAVVAGELSLDHVAVLAEHVANPRVGDQVEATQTLWVERAATTSFVDWKHQLDGTVARLDQDGGYDPNRDLARNHLRLTPYPTGSVGLAGELVGERALVVRQNVEAHADRLYHRLKRDHDLCPELPLPSRSTLLAMALAELVSRGVTVDPEHSSGPTTDITLVIEATRPGCCGGPTEVDPGPRADASGSAPNSGTIGVAPDPRADTQRSRGIGGPTGVDADPELSTNPTRGPLVLPPPAHPAHPAHPADTSDRFGRPGADLRHGDGGWPGSTDETGSSTDDHFSRSPKRTDHPPPGRSGLPDQPEHQRPCAHPARPGLHHGERPDQTHTIDLIDPPELVDPYAAVDRHTAVGLTRLCGPAHTPDGYLVADQVAATLLCDPAIHALIVDTLGVALDLGRTTRYANREQRRALAHRDGGCVFPGCDAPVGWCDAHHVRPWDNGGPTNLDNLALLCRYHHGVTHRTGWAMTAHQDQTFTWRTPLGQTLHSQRHRGRSPTDDRAA